MASTRARAAFDRLPFGLKRKYVAAVEQAKNDIVDNKITVSAVADAEGMKAKLAELFPQ